MGTSDIIKLINRDELTHVVLFQQLIKNIFEENPELLNEQIIYQMFDEAVKQEIIWTNHIIGNNISGITYKTTEEYTKFLANKRLMNIGLKPLYPNSNKNPYINLEIFSDTEGAGNVKANFFEGTVTSYNMSSSIEGWDEF